MDARQLAESRERAAWHEVMSRGKVDLPEQLQVASHDHCVAPALEGRGRVAEAKQTSRLHKQLCYLLTYL